MKVISLCSYNLCPSFRQQVDSTAVKVLVFRANPVINLLFNFLHFIETFLAKSILHCPEQVVFWKSNVWRVWSMRKKFSFQLGWSLLSLLSRMGVRVINGKNTSLTSSRHRRRFWFTAQFKSIIYCWYTSAVSFGPGSRSSQLITTFSARQIQSRNFIPSMFLLGSVSTVWLGLPQVFLSLGLS